MSKTLTSIFTAALFALSGMALPAIAEDGHKHEGKEHADHGKAEKSDVGHSHEGKHGGKIVESGHHHLEIVAKDGVLELYVDGEDGKPEDIKDAKATAAVLSEGKKVDITLAADPANFLKGAGDFKAAKGTTIVITLTMPGHDPEQSRVKLD